jgi:hypothetical protein
LLDSLNCLDCCKVVSFGLRDLTEPSFIALDWNIFVIANTDLSLKRGPGEIREPTVLLIKNVLLPVPVPDNIYSGGPLSTRRYS